MYNNMQAVCDLEVIASAKSCQYRAKFTRVLVVRKIGNENGNYSESCHEIDIQQRHNIIYSIINKSNYFV